MLRMAFSYSASRGALEGGYALCAVSYGALHFGWKEDSAARDTQGRAFRRFLFCGVFADAGAISASRCIFRVSNAFGEEE